MAVSPARSPATREAAVPARPAPNATPARRPSGNAPTGGVPLLRLSAPNTPLGQRPKVTPSAYAPTLAAGPGEPTITLAGAGQPLDKTVRDRLESSFGVDLGAVRVHQGDAATRLAEGYGARAFAFGHHVVLGERASPRDVGLMAHEVAHVIQQRSSALVQRCTGGVCTCGGSCGGSVHEQEASRAAAAASAGGEMHVSGHATPTVQREEENEGFLINRVWGILEDFAPDLVPIVRKGPSGVLDWIKDKVTGAIQGFINTVMAPVRAAASAGQWLHGYFGPLIAQIQEAAVKIAHNDCKPIQDAIAKIEEVATKIITPIVEKVQAIAGKIGDFFKAVWDRFGAPVWDFIKAYAAWHWEQLQKLGTWIWDKTAPVRRLASRAWTWLKNKIGIGEGPEGQNGILQWIQGKASAAWDWVQAKIEPYKKQITAVAAVVGGILVLVSPAGPFVVAGAAIYGAVQGIRWLRANMAGGNAIVKARTYAQTVLIPQLMAGINRATAAVTKMAAALGGKLGDFAAGLGRLVGAAANTALQFLVDAAQWLAEKAAELASWATEQLGALVKWLTTAFDRLYNFLKPVLDFFAELGKLVIDIMGLPLLVGGWLWKKIPACIRDPFIDWIIPLILKQIDIFKELVKNDEAWAKTKADVMNLIRLVFVNKDLLGAIKATFHLILRVFNVPYDLFMQVLRKAAVAWDTVVAAPIAFLKNCVKTIGRGFRLYWDTLWDNLLFGIEGWLFGELAEKGISKPQSWTDPWDLLQFALDVMGLSVSHVFELMEKSQLFSKETVAILRKAYQYLSRAWNWIMDMRGKKPQEVTETILGQVKEFGKSILEGIVGWIVKQVSAELAAMAAAAAASAGISEVIDVARRIYKAIKSAVRWAKKILDVVNTVLDAVANIAAGIIEPPAILLKEGMKLATPAVIGILAEQVGLGNVGEALRGIVDKLREKVDNAIIGIFKKLKSFFDALVAGAKGLAAKVLEWWKEKRSLRGADGKTHQLSFEGERESAVPMVASEPKKVEDFINEVEGRPEGKKAPAPDLIAKVRAQLKIIAAEQKRPEAEKEKADEAIATAVDAMVPALERLLGRGEFATKDDPLDIEYPKPTWNEYPTIYVGPLSAKRIPQSLLKNARVNEIRDILTDAESKAWDGTIKAYPPSASPQTLPNNDTHPGIAQKYRTGEGCVIELHPGNTQGGSKVNKLFRPFGYRAQEEDPVESKDGDHLVEMQLGGPNELENLWPLKASQNRSGGSRVASMVVKIAPKDEITMDDLKKRSQIVPTFLRIKSTVARED